MKIILIGYNGKMGQNVINCLTGEDSVVQKIGESDELDEKNFGDVIIDFSTAKSREKFIKYSFENKIPYCCFATNYNDDDLKNLKKLSHIVPVLICSNASKGVNLMFDMIKSIAPKVNNGDIIIEEYHHKQKIDSPSGTARKIESIFQDNGKQFKTHAFRVGNECGTHIVKIFFEDEVLEIKHVAKSRRIFALGAIELSRELIQKDIGLYEI